MKKHVFLLAALIFAGASLKLSAGPIDAQKALDIATNFFASQSSDAAQMRGASALTIEYTARPETGLRAGAPGQNLYYVINRGNNEGFVIISGDDRVPELLGYSEEGALKSEDIANHPSLRGFFADWNRQMEYALVSLPDRPYVVASTLRADTLAAEVKPLLMGHKDGHIAWDQGYPFNFYCPSVTYNNKTYPTVSGCVATGMASVMRWYRWPDRPVGKIGYNWSWKYGTASASKYLSVDLDKQAAYDWNIMDARPKKGIEESHAKEIGRLLYHVGVSVKMNYGPGFTGGSGAWVWDCVTSLVDNFKYKKTAAYVTRDKYTKEQWMKMVKTELQHGPIIYAGYSEGGGHCFVLDGYDKKDLVHVDWGWNAMSNGYFRIDILDPGDQGTGGGSGGFAYKQQMVHNLFPNRPGTPDTVPPNPDTPPTPTVKTELSIAAAPTSSVSNSSVRYSVDFRLDKITNSGKGAFTGKVGLAIKDRYGKLQLLKAVNANNLPPYSQEKNVYHASLRYVYFSQYAAGNYTIVPIYAIPENGVDQWYYFNSNGKSVTLNARIYSGRIYFSAGTATMQGPANMGESMTSAQAAPAEAALYPTTCDSEINVSAPKGYTEATAFDATGARVGLYVMSTGVNTIDVSGFAPGTYILQLKGQDMNPVTMRFVKR